MSTNMRGCDQCEGGVAWPTGPSFGLIMNTAIFSEWLLYDDEKVSTIKESEVVDSTAYILFYRHRGRRKNRTNSN